VSQGENVAKEELFPWVFEFEIHWCDHFKLLITFLGLHSDKEKDRAVYTLWQNIFHFVMHESHNCYLTSNVHVQSWEKKLNSVISVDSFYRPMKFV
jgi:hypothetical protein